MPADRYEIVILHDGPLSDAEKVLARKLQDRQNQSAVPANLEVRTIQADAAGRYPLLYGVNGLIRDPNSLRLFTLDTVRKTVEYYRTRSGKLGLLAGIQSYSMILVFNQQAALDTFRTGDREWEVGVDASVAVAEVGASGKMDTTNLQEAKVSTFKFITFICPFSHFRP